MDQEKALPLPQLKRHEDAKVLSKEELTALSNWTVDENHAPMKGFKKQSMLVTRATSKANRTKTLNRQ